MKRKEKVEQVVLDVSRNDDWSEVVPLLTAIPDPRREHLRRHALADVLFAALTACICGADNFTEFEEFCEHRLDWLRRFVPMEGGVPSHDTFRRVFMLISPLALQKLLEIGPGARKDLDTPDVVAIDGKATRASGGKSEGGRLLHTVSAWMVEGGLVLGQEVTDLKSNEITAIPNLLESLMIEGCVVTIDAGGCYSTIAETIISRKASYVLQVKANQANLASDIETTFSPSTPDRGAAVIGANQFA